MSNVRHRIVVAEVYLFDIPIYWIAEDKFWAQYESDLSTHLKGFEKQTGYPLTDELRTSLTDHFWKRYVAPWRFNQIVGWVRLYKLGNQIRGELWYMNAKRAGRTLIKKQFSDHGKAFEMSTHPNQSAAEIHAAIRTELDHLAKLRGRKYILDLREFEALGPFVDWRSLIYGKGDA